LLWVAIIGIGIGVADAIAVAIGFCRPTQPIAAAIATPIPIPIPMVASQTEHSLFIRCHVHPGAWATVPKLASDFRPARGFAGVVWQKDCRIGAALDIMPGTSCA